MKNKAKALRVLRSGLYESEMEKQQKAVADERRSMVGTGERSEKIRTYNYPQNRVTDHRIALTLHRLDSIIDGAIPEIIDALTAHYQAERMKNPPEDTAAACACVKRFDRRRSGLNYSMFRLTADLPDEDW